MRLEGPHLEIVDRENARVTASTRGLAQPYLVGAYMEARILRETCDLERPWHAWQTLRELPDDAETSITLTQPQPDGTDIEIILHGTARKVETELRTWLDARCHAIERCVETAYEEILHTSTSIGGKGLEALVEAIRPQATHPSMSVSVQNQPGGPDAQNAPPRRGL